MKKVIYLTKMENKILEAILDCCVVTAPGTERIRKLYKKIREHFQNKGEKMSSGRAWSAVDNLLKIGILKKVFEKAIPGEKKAATTYEFSRETYDNAKIEIVKKRNYKMREEVGLPSENKSEKFKKAEKVEKISLENEEVMLNDMEIIYRAKELLDGKQREFDNLILKAELVKKDIEEITKNLEAYKVSRLYLSRL